MDILNSEFLLFLTCTQQNNLRYLLIGGYAVNYYGYSRNTIDMDIWLAPTNENKRTFINTLLCMKYSENEAAPLYEEDFTNPFVGTTGSDNQSLDVFTIVYQEISFDDAGSKKKYLKQNRIC